VLETTVLAATVTAYLARRVLQAVAVVLLVTLIVFGLLQLGPDAAREGMLGTGPAHQEFLLQYLSWLGHVLQGNLGVSTRLGEPVTTLLATSLPRTLVLMGISTLLALAVSIPLGLLQAVRRGSAADNLLRTLTVVFYGTPAFVLGNVLILVFGVHLRLFGAEAPQAAGIGGILTDWRDLTLPVVTLALVTIAIFARYMRSAAADTLQEEYVEAARARGAGDRRILTRHVLRNSLAPIVTLVGLSIPQILGGAIIVETLFNFQGVGWQIWEAALSHDLPVILGFTLVIGIGAAVGSLLADIGYAILDPRVRFAGQ
jgi:peptide/nickel transport system permease protein